MDLAEAASELKKVDGMVVTLPDGGRRLHALGDLSDPDEDGIRMAKWVCGIVAYDKEWQVVPPPIFTGGPFPAPVVPTLQDAVDLTRHFFHVRAGFKELDLLDVQTEISRVYGEWAKERGVDSKMELY